MAIYISKQSGLWSSASTWLSALPAATFSNTVFAISAQGNAGQPPQSGAGDKIIIGSGATVTYDVVGEFGDDGSAWTLNNSQHLWTNAISISGASTLKASRTVNTSLSARGSICVGGYTANNFIVGGVFDWGTESDPVLAVTSEIVFGTYSSTLNALSARGGRCLINAGGNSSGMSPVPVHGVTICGKSKTRNTILSGNHTTGTSTITAVDVTGWQVGDRLIFEPYLYTSNTSITNAFATISNINGNVIIISPTLPSNYSSGASVGNFTSNITLRPAVTASNSSSFGGIYIVPNQNPSSVYSIKNCTIKDVHSTALDNNNYNISGGYGALATWGGVPIVPVVYDSVAIDYNILVNSNVFSLLNQSTQSHQFKNLAIYGVNTAQGGSVVYSRLGAAYNFENNVIYKYNLAFQPDQTYTSVATIKNSKCYTSSRPILGNGYNWAFTNCYFRNYDGLVNVTNGIGTMTFDSCTVVGTNNATYRLIDTVYGTFGNYIFTNCTLSAISIPTQPLTTVTTNVGRPGLTVKLNSLNSNSLDNRRFNNFYTLSSDYTNRNRSTASYKVQSCLANTQYYFTDTIEGFAGVTRRFIGYIKYDSAYGTTNLPYITFTDATQTVTQTFSCSPTPNIWQKFDISLTPFSNGNITMTFTGQTSSITANAYLDGIPFYPITPKARHYGFNFDEAISYRTTDTLTTLTENLVSAISTISNLDYLYDASNYWSVTNPSLTSYTDLYTQNGKILDFGSRNITLSSSSIGFTYLSATNTIILNTASLSAGVNFNTITTTGTITLSTQSLSNITINGNVNQTIPSDLNGVTINGILSYNTNNSYAITYTNTNILTARNLGSGTVTIQQINSIITDPKAPQIQTYAATYLNLTLQGGYIAIYDQNGVQQYYTNSDQTIALPASSIGTWTYKIGRYGYKMISGSFTINPSVGGTLTITPTYVQDIYVNDLVTNVANYTDFTSTQNIYDYLSYYRTTSSGLSSGELNSYIASLDIGSNPLILSNTASQVFTYDGSKFIIKSSSIQGKAITTTGGINLSGSTTISNITLNSDVSSNVVGNLNSVNVNGILTYNTNTPTNIIYTNTNVLTARNDGSAIVNIKRINSTITDATDAEIQSYAPTYISLTLLGGYIAIYDDSNVQKYYTNSDGTIELPYSATGTWSYKIGRYGYKYVNGTFIVNRSVGGTVTIAPVYEQDIYVVGSLATVSSYNIFSKTQHIYDYLSYYRTTSAGLVFGEQNLYSSTLDVGSNNIILFDSASPAFSYDGTTFTLNALNLSGAAIKTTGTISISGNSSISDIELTTDVLDQTPNDLTNVKINGILKYNTNSPASIVYTNTTVATVVNDGTAKVLIKRVNSSINNATDPEIENYAPTIINVTPDGGSVAIYDDQSTRQYFLNTNSTIVLSPYASGNWSYKVSKFGYDLITQSFTINSYTGATINITPTYIIDNFVTANLQTVSAYTDLNNASQIHNYLMYFQTLSTGIDYGDLESESFGTITFTGNVAFSANASNMVSLSGNTIILKSSYITDDIIFVSPGTITQYAGNTISDGVKLRTASLDSEVYMNLVDSLTLFPSESTRDNNNLTNSIYLANPSIYRFKYGSIVNGVTLSNYLYGKVSTGGAVLLIKSPISVGTNTIDFGTTGNLTTIINNLRVINSGVQKSSILVPHTTNI